MKKVILALGLLIGSVTGAFATCATPSVMHDFPGSAFNMSLATNAGDGNCAPNVGIIGTLPAFASTPSFTISGTLPAYASTPTFNLGTLNGAATAAKQPALGTAGAASADVLSVQGVATMTPLLAGGNGSAGIAGLITCDQSAFVDNSASGLTQIVALASGKTIYVCSGSMGVGGTASSLQLVYGTGTACATGTTNITPSWQLAANSGREFGSPFFNGLKTAASNALCLRNSGANAAQTEIHFAQF